VTAGPEHEVTALNTLVTICEDECADAHVRLNAATSLLHYSSDCGLVLDPAAEEMPPARGLVGKLTRRVAIRLLERTLR
jgi:hypothetical protein